MHQNSCVYLSFHFGQWQSRKGKFLSSACQILTLSDWTKPTSTFYDLAEEKENQIHHIIRSCWLNKLHSFLYIWILFGLWTSPLYIRSNRHYAFSRLTQKADHYSGLFSFSVGTHLWSLLLDSRYRLGCTWMCYS